MSGLHRTGRVPSALRLDRGFRSGLYAAFAVLFATGAAWLAADALKDSPNGEFWQGTSSWLLMIHGGTAMAVLVLLGALFPTHVQRAWRSRLNRIAGVAMAALNGVLIVTAFALYYAGTEALRAWVSDVHIIAGLAFPALLLTHVLIGRRRTDVRAAMGLSMIAKEPAAAEPAE
jgi:hypothetical protein